MLDKAEVTRVVEEALEGSDLYVVQVTITRDNIITVDLDSDSSVDIDQCIRVNDAVLAAFDRDVEDYELTVGSYGISSPLLVRRQYDKNIGQDVEVLTRDGRKLKGVLTQADDEGFTIEVPTKVKVEGKKRPEHVMVAERITYDNAKQTKCIITF
jgi:ribosome maturation factor RimP